MSIFSGGNICKVACATTGTSDFTLGSAVASYLAFPSSLNGKTITYLCVDANGGRELGRGVYTSSGTTLTRATILASTNSGSKISLSGSSQVSIEVAAEDLVWFDEAQTFTDAQRSQIQTNLGTGATEPSGRLTLTSATPILSATVSGASTVYFTPFEGNMAPFWNGSSYYWDSFAELSQALSDTTKSPAAAGNSEAFFMLLWKDGTTKRCTRSVKWSSLTAIGSGTGTAELVWQNGYLVNKYAITNGPAAGYGLVVGGFATNASGTVDFIFGAAASGGTAGVHNLQNRFNRRPVISQVQDNGTGYTYDTSTVRAARASNTNRVTFFSAFADASPEVTYQQKINTGSNNGNQGIVGATLDATNTMTLCEAISVVSVSQSGVFVEYPFCAGHISYPLGSHYVQATEWAAYAAGAHVTFGGTLDEGGGNYAQGLKFKYLM